MSFNYTYLTVYVQSKWKQKKCKGYEKPAAKPFIERVRKIRDQSVNKLKAMDGVKNAIQTKPESLEEKRERKYLAKFSYRTKLISKKCPTGRSMGTPAHADNKGQRAILKYLKTDEVGY